MLLIFILSFIGPNTPAFSSSQVSIATLNTWMIPFLRRRAHDRASYIGEALSKYDGVFLQEVFNQKQKRIYKSKLKGYNFFDEFRPLGKITSGLMSLTKFPILERRFIRYKSCKMFQCFANKGVMLTRIKISDDITMDIYNTHTEPFSSRTWIRNNQFNQLIRFIKANDPLQMNPTVILGDFNIHSETQEYSALNFDLEQIGFRDAWVEKNGSAPGITWNTFINEWGQRIAKNPKDWSKERIDYIYVRSGVSSQIGLDSVELILNERVQLRSGDMQLHFPSDHFGVGATLSLY
jgi:endonuclease/exonuclease/phosphatase family metal-dependent hydrolase